MQNPLSAELIDERLCELIKRMNPVQVRQYLELSQRFAVFISQDRKLEFAELSDFLTSALAESSTEAYGVFLSTVHMYSGELTKAMSIVLELEYAQNAR